MAPRPWPAPDPARPLTAVLATAPSNGKLRKLQFKHHIQKIQRHKAAFWGQKQSSVRNRIVQYDYEVAYRQRALTSEF